MKKLLLIIMLCVPFYHAHGIDFPADENSTSRIDHQKFAVFLKKYRDRTLDGRYKIHLFDYAAAKADRANLQDYLTNMQQKDLSAYNKASHYAYWLNIYNALVINLILEYYPINLFRDIELASNAGQSPWTLVLFEKDGEQITLDTIQHRILRENFDDWRLHFAIHSGVISSGTVPKEPFTGRNIETQLEKTVKAHFQKPLTIMLVEDNMLRLTAVMHWYNGDFTKNETLEEILRRYRPDVAETFFRTANRRYEYFFDWRLNDINNR